MNKETEKNFEGHHANRSTGGSTREELAGGAARECSPCFARRKKNPFSNEHLSPESGNARRYWQQISRNWLHDVTRASASLRCLAYLYARARARGKRKKNNARKVNGTFATRGSRSRRTPGINPASLKSEY